MRALKSVMKFQYETFTRHSALCLFIQYNTHYESGIIMTTEDIETRKQQQQKHRMPAFKGFLHNIEEDSSQNN